MPILPVKNIYEKHYEKLFIVNFKNQFEWDHSFKEKDQSKSFISCRWMQLNNYPYTVIFI